MRRPPLDIVNTTGNAVEIAYRIGKIRRRQIQKRVVAWDQLVQRGYAGKRDLLNRLEKGFLVAAYAAAPDYLEEIRAMAEGADVPFQQLFRLNLTELNAYLEKCTTLVFATHGPPCRKGILIAHNEDWDPMRNDIFVLNARLPDMSYCIITYDGYLPGLSCGMNSAGVIHAVNYLRPCDLRIWLPRIFITRKLVTVRSIPACIAWIKKQRRAFGQSIHLAQGERYVNLELTAHQLVVRRPRLPTAHANHYLSRFRTLAASPTTSSRTRQETADRLLTEAHSHAGRPKRDRKSRPIPLFSASDASHLAKTILSDRSGLPHALWREADRPEEGSATLGMFVLRTDRTEILAYRGRPDKSRPRTIALSEPD